MSSDGGKGSSPRPFSVDPQTFEDNWNKIFKQAQVAERSNATVCKTVYNREFESHPVLQEKGTC